MLIPYLSSLVPYPYFPQSPTSFLLIVAAYPSIGSSLQIWPSSSQARLRFWAQDKYPVVGNMSVKVRSIKLEIKDSMRAYAAHRNATHKVEACACFPRQLECLFQGPSSAFSRCLAFCELGLLAVTGCARYEHWHLDDGV